MAEAAATGPAVPAIPPAGGPPEGFLAAQRLTSSVARRLASELRPGMTERSIAELAERYADALGASGTWGPNLVGAGPGNLVCHPDSPPTDRAIEPVDLVWLDLTPTVDGWLGDYALSVVFGDDAVRRQLVDDCRRLQLEIIAAARPGMPANELFGFAAGRFEAEGLELLDLLGNIGHSQGREFAEFGFIDPSNPAPMWAGWTIEPHLGRAGLGAKFEEIIWLGPDGSSVLE